MRAPLSGRADKQMLYLAPMAKNCRFPAAAIVSVTAARRPREDKLPIQVRASSEEGKRGRRRNPIPLLSFLPPSSPFERIMKRRSTLSWRRREEETTIDSSFLPSNYSTPFTPLPSF